MEINLIKKYKYERRLIQTAKYTLFATILLFLFLREIFLGFIVKVLAMKGIFINISSITFYSFLVIFIVILYFFIYFYLRKKKLTVNKAVIPYYEIQKKIHPSLVGTIFDGSFDYSDFDAGIADLIINDLMVIEEKEIKGKIIQIWRKIPRNNLNNKNLFNNKIRKYLYDRLFDLEKSETPANHRVPQKINKNQQNSWFIYNDQKHHIDSVYQDLESIIKNTKYFQNSNLFSGIKVLFGIILLIATVFIIALNPEAMKKENLSLIKILLIGMFYLILAIFIFKQRSKEGFKLAHNFAGYYDFLKTTNLYKLSSNKLDKGFEKHFPYAVAFGLIDIFNNEFLEQKSNKSLKLFKNTPSISDKNIKEKKAFPQITIYLLAFGGIFLFIILLIMSILLTAKLGYF